MALYVLSTVPPFTRQEPEQDLTFKTLARWIPTSIVEYNLKYSRRADYCIHEQGLNSLVYVKEKIDSTITDDWLALTMIDLSHILREQELGILAIVAQFSDFKDVIDFETEGEGEGLFLFHGHTHQAIRYPYAFDVGEVNAEMLLLWSRRTVIGVELP